jgi:hypothetical protein
MPGRATTVQAAARAEVVRCCYCAWDLDDEVMSAPVIQATRFGARARIAGGEGGFPPSEAQTPRDGSPAASAHAWPASSR